MKSILLFFVLLIIKDTLADNLKIKRTTADTFKYKTELTNVLQSIGLNAEDIISKASEQCLTSIENTHDCFQNVNNIINNTNKNEQKFEEICNIYNSQSCDYFRNSIISGNSGCVNEYDMKYFSLNFDMAMFYYASICTKNTANTYCPAVTMYRSIFSNDNSQVTKTNKEEIVKQSCTDSNCSDQIKKIISLTPSVLKLLDLTLSISGETNQLNNEIKNSLDVTAMDEASKSCNNNNNNNIISNAKTNNLSITAFTIIIMIFSFFVFFLLDNIY